MKRIGLLILLLILLGVFLKYNRLQPVPQGPDLGERVNLHATRTIDAWRVSFDKPIEERIAPATPELVDFLKLDNEFQGWTERPATTEPDKALQADLKRAIQSIPQAVRELLKNKLIGIYLVQSLGGSAYTNEVKDAAGVYRYGYIVLDVRALDRKANEWMTWKENTPYEPEAGYELRAKIAEAAEDDRVSALRYILLHEMGHVVGIGTDEIPRFDANLSDPKLDPQGFRFAKLSWQHRAEDQGGGIASRFDNELNLFSRGLRYYAAPDARRPLSEAVDDYTRLEKTNFVTLYAATNMYDDLAESFVSYVHVVLMHKPWRIQVTKGDDVLIDYKACWGAARCQEKLQAMERILNPPRPKPAAGIKTQPKPVGTSPPPPSATAPPTAPSAPSAPRAQATP